MCMRPTDFRAGRSSGAAVVKGFRCLCCCDGGGGGRDGKDACGGARGAALVARTWAGGAAGARSTCGHGGGRRRRRGGRSDWSRWQYRSGGRAARTAQHASQGCPARRESMRAAPLLALLVFARSASAGICWSSMERSGRCSSVLAEHVSREQCCSGSRATPAAWSEQDLDSGALFFWKVLGGGVACKACTESCAGMACAAGRHCAVRGGRARCVCGVRCGRAGPVCGSDGRTYRSLCRLRRRACRRPNKHIVLDYPGHCQVGDCRGVRCGGGKRCILDAELGAHCVRCPSCSGTGDMPLCAVDGLTYAGACALRRAACERGKALPLAYRGPCIGNATCADMQCSVGQRCVAGGGSGARCVTCGACVESGARGARRRRMCGDNMRTYTSWCRLQKDVCETGRLVQPLHSGPCRRNETIKDIHSDVRVDRVDTASGL